MSLKRFKNKMCINRFGILVILLAWCARGLTVHKILTSGYSKGFYNLSFDGDTGRNFTCTNQMPYP